MLNYHAIYFAKTDINSTEKSESVALKMSILCAKVQKHRGKTASILSIKVGKD